METPDAPESKTPPHSSLCRAENGEEGWSTFTQSPNSFDLIISDLKMPICGGLELLGRIRDHLYQIPVIIASGEGTLQKSIAAFKLGIR